MSQKMVENEEIGGVDTNSDGRNKSIQKASAKEVIRIEMQSGAKNLKDEAENFHKEQENDSEIDFTDITVDRTHISKNGWRLHCGHPNKYAYDEEKRILYFDSTLICTHLSFSVNSILGNMK